MNAAKLECVFAGDDPVRQSRAVGLLARCFDEWREFQKRYGDRFPFLELSFLALGADGAPAGHVGLMPFEISDGRGGSLRMAGVASVGVAPEYRGRGIAAMLCEAAAVWAREHGFDAMPLYTGVPPVYARCGWKTVPSGGRTLSAPPERAAARRNWRQGSDLSEAEKTFIRRCYENSPPLAGRVRREEAGKSFHAWSNLFANELNRFLVTPEGYALTTGGVLAEMAGDTDAVAGAVTEVPTAFLAPHDPAARSLLRCGWQITPARSDAPDCWHGEVAMVKTLAGRPLPDELFFPLPDKF